jgi:glycosyltransferase involved in cell wall biosynthesis
VATLEPRKGLDVLVAAMAELGADAPTLVVVGQPGWGGVDLRTLAAGAGLPADRLVVTGRLADPDLAALLQEASALVMPSRAEGFGLPVAEAMAAGTPVICTDAPALVEVAGDAGLVVPRGDAEALAAAIAALLDDGALQDELAEAGLQQAARHTWDAVADRAWELFRRLA